MARTEQALAIHGGRPVRTAPWPAWPVVTEETERLLLEALRSGRWTVSGAYTGRESFEQRFVHAFAEFMGTRYCIATCHGSSALTVALEALGVGPGKEALVPGLTWVACASSVTGVGAVPILVDIDSDTLCMSPEAAAAAITDRTAAIMLVHLFGSAGDIDAFRQLSEKSGVPLLEDVSQAHGATWRGRRLGSFGKISALSFQQTKLLTAGEGGAVLCDDPVLAERAEQLRADGRLTLATPRIGDLDLEEVGDIQGRNYCLTEFQAALLLDGLTRLDAQNARREANVAYLASRLEEVPGIAIQAAPAPLDRRSFYHLCLRIAPEAWGGHPVDDIARWVREELNLGGVEPVDTPLSRNRLYNPLVSPRTSLQARAELDPSRFALPAAEAARATCFTLPHRALLGDTSDMDCIVDALVKVQQHATREDGTG